MSIAPSPLRPFASSHDWRRAAKPLFAATALGGAIAWHGADRQPADATRPLVLRGEAEVSHDDRDTIRLGTFNIHGGRGPGGTVDLAATASVLAEADIDLAGLYEVRGSFTSDQAEGLGERLAMASLFVGTERRWWHEHFGNGLITDRPLRGVVRIDLPGTQGKRFRSALLTTFNVGETIVKVVAAHIDTEADREKQLDLVFELFRSLEAPVVLMGDLNCTVEHPPLAALLRQPKVIDAVAAKLGPASRPGRIDHLIVRGLNVRDAGVTATQASDHPLVWAELAVP